MIDPKDQRPDESDLDYMERMVFGEWEEPNPQPKPIVSTDREYAEEHESWLDRTWIKEDEDDEF